MSADRITLNGIEYVRADRVQSRAAAPIPKHVPQPRMVERRCLWCKGPFQARAADVKRGWAKFCSKSCKASRQEQRTGQYRAQQHGERLSRDEQAEQDHQ